MIAEVKVVHVKTTGHWHRRYDLSLSEEEMKAFLEASAPERASKWVPSPSHRALHAELQTAFNKSRDVARRTA